MNVVVFIVSARAIPKLHAIMFFCHNRVAIFKANLFFIYFLPRNKNVETMKEQRSRELHSIAFPGGQIPAKLVLT